MNKKQKYKFIGLSFAMALMSSLNSQAQFLPTPTQEAKPGVRWWWMGSAVDKENLKWNLDEYAKAGIGAVEITPLYGVQGNDKNDIPYLSPKWMDMLKFVEKENKQVGIETDMATGTGWPFGGPWVPISEAACKAVFVDTIVDVKQKLMEIEFNVPQKERAFAKLKVIKAFPVEGEKYKKRVIALYESRTRQKVKRAAPGGEGYVIDHFDSTAVANYLHHIDSAFVASKTPYPHTFFNDSYEVSESDYTPTLFQEFYNRRGYSLEENFDKLVDGDTKVVADYRETLGDMLLDNFTRTWTAWAHSHGAITRNQAHGSPANLIDCYAAVDIPEIEGFGLTNFGIKGLRQDPGKTRKNDSDFSMLKYAPSAAHIMGKPYTSSETFTWLTEHFRTSLSQMKPDMDLMFCAGVNHMFFHGTAYSPQHETWPGWRFYASIDMSPNNTIWRDAPYFMKYVERCQSMLQMGRPDNDFLTYLPIHDMWAKRSTGKRLMQFSIHAMGKLAPEFVKCIDAIDQAGFDCDYISDRILLDTYYNNGMLHTPGGTTYKGLVIPSADNILTPAVKAHIEKLKAQGANIIVGTSAADLTKAAKAEKMKTELGLKLIRRSNDKGHHYFIANLTPNDIQAYTTLAVPMATAMWFDPMTGYRQRAEICGDSILVNLRSGESIILQTFNHKDEALSKELASLPVRCEWKKTSPVVKTLNNWKLSFTEATPAISKTYNLDTTKAWENLDDSTRTLMGTGVYECTINLSAAELKKGNSWTIDLGDVRESARVYVNDSLIGCAWAVPYRLSFANLLHKGNNKIRIEVTNLPANRISELDRQGYKWRKFDEINVVDINYKKTSYADWTPVASGLNSEVKLIKE